MHKAKQLLAAGWILLVIGLPGSLAAQAFPRHVQRAIDQLADPKTPDSGLISRVTARLTLEREAAQAGGADIARALTPLLAGKRPLAVRLNALIAITNIAKASPAAAAPATDMLLALLTAKEFPIRFWAVKLAATTKHKPSVRKLHEMLLARKDAAMLLQIVQSLGQLGDPSSLKPLQAVLKDGKDLGNDKDGSLRAGAADALKAMHDSASVSSLLAGLRDSDPRVATACANALTAITGCPISIDITDDTAEKRTAKIGTWQKCWESKQK